jgi:hypothetical protein
MTIAPADGYAVAQDRNRQRGPERRIRIVVFAGIIAGNNNQIRVEKLLFYGVVEGFIISVIIDFHRRVIKVNLSKKLAIAVFRTVGGGHDNNSQRPRLHHAAGEQYKEDQIDCTIH